MCWCPHCTFCNSTAQGKLDTPVELKSNVKSHFSYLFLFDDCKWRYSIGIPSIAVWALFKISLLPRTLSGEFKLQNIQSVLEAYIRGTDKKLFWFSSLLHGPLSANNLFWLAFCTDLWGQKLKGCTHKDCGCVTVLYILWPAVVSCVESKPSKWEVVRGSSSIAGMGINIFAFSICTSRCKVKGPDLKHFWYCVPMEASASSS